MFKKTVTVMKKETKSDVENSRTPLQKWSYVYIQDSNYYIEIFLLSGIIFYMKSNFGLPWWHSG